MSSGTKFVFVTPAYNCTANLIQTVRSVYAQSYKDWRMVVYDDMSTDDTAQTIEDMSKELKLGSKLSVVSRNEKYGEVRNTVDAVKSIEDREVVCRLDAGDWLTDLDTLAILDAIYTQHNPAVLWTKQRWSYTDHNISGPLSHPDVDINDHPWVTSHLKTFRCDAMRGINKQNYVDENGRWIMIACDQAVFLPMLHKAHLQRRPRLFLPLVMYHYNIDLSDPNLFSSERSLKQKASGEWIRARGYVE